MGASMTPAQPAFLIGCHRSGTTLLRFILDAHPSLACPPESKFIGAMHAAFDYPQCRTALASLGVSGRDMLDVMASITQTVMQRFAANAGKQRWIDKTPNYVHHIEFIDQLFRERAQYIFICRHPLDTALSLAATFHRESATEDPDLAPLVAKSEPSLATWTTYWSDVYARLSAFASLRKDRVLWCRYEDLVNAPDITLKTVFSFLGEEATVASVESALSCYHAPGYEDGSIRKTDRLHRRGIHRHNMLTAATKEALWAPIAPLAERLGYSIEDESDCVSLTGGLTDAANALSLRSAGQGPVLPGN